MRPARKARGGRIPGVCNRRATPRPGMQRRPNVTGLRRRDTRSDSHGRSCRTARRARVPARMRRSAGSEELMTDTRCPSPIGFAEVVDYWAGELTPGRRGPDEEHVFACADCARELAVGEALARGIAAVAREGRLHSVVTDAILNRLAADGVRIRTYALEDGGVVPCAVWADDDLVVSRIRADFAEVDSVTIVTRQAASGDGIGRIPDVAIRPGQREILNAYPAAEYCEAATAARFSGDGHDAERKRRTNARRVHASSTLARSIGWRASAEVRLGRSGVALKLVRSRETGVQFLSATTADSYFATIPARRLISTAPGAMAQTDFCATVLDLDAAPSAQEVCLASPASVL